jgi:hypothetical protein
MLQSKHAKAIRMAEWVALYRQHNPSADRWAAGYGCIQHALETQARVMAMVETLAARSTRGDGVPLFELLHAADRVASAAMWLVVHETYARHVYLDGRDLAPEDFKPHPKGTPAGRSTWFPPMSAIWRSMPPLA